MKKEAVNKRENRFLTYLNKIVSTINNWSRISRILFYSVIIILLISIFIIRIFYLEGQTSRMTLPFILNFLDNFCALRDVQGESCGWLVFSLYIYLFAIVYISIFMLLIRFKIENKTKLLIHYGLIGYGLGLIRIFLTLNTISDYSFGWTLDVFIIILLFPLGYTVFAILLGFAINAFKFKHYVYAVFMAILLIILSSDVIPYKMETPNMTVHQHITKEASKVWKLAPFEIKNHTNSDITAELDNLEFQEGEDTIVGSGEEDVNNSKESHPYFRHFWNPDEPNGGDYDEGLVVFESSYERARRFWTKKVIPAYLKGDINESYYWLGRVAHLLEDASQPSHVLLDCHPGSELYLVGRACGQSNGDGGADDSVLEEYTGRNFTLFQNRYNWTGSNFVGQQYNYETLPNMDNFNWKEVEANSPLDKQNIELFRLFWYVAQKTQYFASDDVDGNFEYVLKCEIL